MKRLLPLIYATFLTTNALAAKNVGTVVERTGHGIVHVTAKTYKGIGFGVGYAYTEDNRCVLAHRIAQVNGRLAEQLGANVLVRMQAQATTMNSQLMDALFQTYFNSDTIREGFSKEPQSVRDLAEGYAAGVNQYLKEHSTLTACAPVNFTGEVTVDDIYRMWMATAGISGVEYVGPFLSIYEQVTPSAKASVIEQSTAEALAINEHHVGSNAMAIGRDGVAQGGPLHLYNPHFPWDGIQRTYIIHARIPGKLDVMGPTLGGFPLPLSGFNKTMAWGITFSSTPRVNLMEVKPLANDPTSYLVDGKVRKITSKMIPIKVAGETEPRKIIMQVAEDGPIIFAGRLDPTAAGTGTFIVNDVNLGNTRLVNQWLTVAKAKTVQQVKTALETLKGVPWSYTTAVDVNGDTFFGEISAIPNIPNELYQTCKSSSPPAAALRTSIGMVTLDGSRSACYPTGTLAANLLPSVIRTDYVANSNNNFEWPNANTQLTALAPALGLTNVPLQLRPSLGLKMIEERLAGNDGLGAPGFTAQTLKQLFDDKRDYAADLLIDDIIAVCKSSPTAISDGETVDITSTCKALQQWDRKHNLNSRGAHVFVGLWRAMRAKRIIPAQLFATPASFSKPLTTPTSDLTSDSFIRGVVLASLAKITKALQTAGIAPDAPWGEVQFVIDPNGNKIGLPGGFGELGIYDAINSIYVRNYDTWLPSLTNGFTSSELTGSSYSHIVELTPTGPVAMGVLAFSQATESNSPWYNDQLALFSTSEMFKFPFTKAEVKADLKSRKVF